MREILRFPYADLLVVLPQHLFFFFRQFRIMESSILVPRACCSITYYIVMDEIELGQWNLGPFLDHFLDHFFRHFLNHFWTIYFYYLLSPQYLYSGLAYKLYEKCLYIKESILVVMQVVIF